MKNFTLKGVLPMLILLAVNLVNAQDNVISLAVASTGSEGDTKYTDASPLAIDASGSVSLTGDAAYHDWSASGTVVLSGALNSSFSVLFGGMATTDTTAAVYGSLLTQGGIDRSNSGELGIRGGASNGIDVNEGFYFGLDLSAVSEDVAVQITGINVKYLGNGEMGAIVSLLDPGKSLTVSAAGDGADVELSNGSGIVDISAFEILIAGGDSVANMVSFFNSGADGNFRIVGLQLTVVDNSSSTSVNDMKTLADQLLIGPNPFNEVLSVHLKDNSFKNATVELFNLSGQSVLRSQDINNAININTTGLSGGVYFCVFTNGENCFTKRVVKK